MKNLYGNHQTFLKKVMLSYQQKFPEARLWESSTGQCYALYSVLNSLKTLVKTGSMQKAMAELKRISYGKIGQPDITGINNGQYIGIEIKTGEAKQSENQKNFQEMILKAGGRYMVVTDQQEIGEQI